MNFELVAVSDIWNRRREEGAAYIQKLSGNSIVPVRNNEELYERKDVDAVLIATADFQHARHGVEAVNAGRDAYVEKPTAHTMEDARLFLAAVKKTGKIVQVGTQRRSTPSYQKAAEYIKSGKFGDIVMVEMTWNVNQPGRWRRPNVVPLLKEQDTDWKRYLMNRPYAPFDARKYLEFRLFWPYSSGIPDQWLVHQIDTVHWFTGYSASTQRRGEWRHLSVEGRTQELGHYDCGVRLWSAGRSKQGLPGAVFVALYELGRRGKGALLFEWRDDGYEHPAGYTRGWLAGKGCCGDGHEGEPVAQLFTPRECRRGFDRGQYQGRSADICQHA